MSSCRPQVTQKELAEALHLSRGRVSHFLSRCLVPGDIPGEEALSVMAKLIGSRHSPPVDHKVLLDKWHRCILDDKLDHYRDKVLREQTATYGVHDPAIYNIVDYARLVLQGAHQAMGLCAPDFKMRHVSTLELPSAVIENNTVIVTENPPTSVVPTATHLIALQQEPAEGDWCLYVTKEGGVRTDVFASAFRPAGSVFKVLHFFRMS